MFWSEFRRLAKARGQPVNALAAQIDAERGDIGLASAIRVWILSEIKSGQ